MSLVPSLGVEVNETPENHPLALLISNIDFARF